MKALKHIYHQPFIFATGIAALIHSTWALGTLFSGIAPVPAFTWAYISWIVPAFLIAFALDVGQISTSSQIREKGMSLSLGFTFVIFAFATYYLQWLYMAVHMPLLDISAGVTGVHYDIAVMLRNVGIWLIPALLPISTVAYTFSSDDSDTKPLPKDQYVDYQDYQINITSLEDTSEALPMIDDEINLLPDAGHIADCEYCDFYRDGYDSELNASKAIKMHYRSCDAYQDAQVQS